jgi:hypothetical protein
MSNVSNYTEQGGARTVIGGEIDVTGTFKADGVEISTQSAAVQAITAAGAITADGTVGRVTLGGTAYAFTLAAPGAGAVGKLLVIEMTGGGTDAKTLALTNVTGGTAATTASFNADGECLVLIGAATKWVVLGQGGGVTLS